MSAPKTVFVIPRKGVILAGIPATGAEVDAALAHEWEAARLATIRRAAPAPSVAPRGTTARVARGSAERKPAVPAEG